MMEKLRLLEENFKEAHTVISVPVHHHFLPLVSVSFTRRLVRGFPTYQTLPEIM